MAAFFTCSEATALLVKMREASCSAPRTKAKPQKRGSKYMLHKKLEDLKAKIAIDRLDALNSGDIGKHQPLNVDIKKRYTGKTHRGKQIVIDPIKTARLRELRQEKIKQSQALKELKSKAKRALEKTVISDRKLKQLAKRVKRTLDVRASTKRDAA